jgi:hypothetical protein
MPLVDTHRLTVNEKRCSRCVWHERVTHVITMKENRAMASTTARH